MDRLPAVVALCVLALAAGCEREGASENPPPAGRFDVAKADPQNARSLDELCTAHSGGAFAPPALASGKTLPRPSGWQWINVWATWCKPCVEEMPLIRRWTDRLRGPGVSLSLVFVSADSDQAAIATFRESHPDAPADYRLADPANLGPWAESVGLSASVTIPIHVFVSPQGKIACARAGALTSADYPLIRRLVGRSP